MLDEPTESTDNAVVDRILAGLAAGKSMAAICRAAGMPDRVTVWRWARGNDALATRILEAREVGFLDRAERAVEAARTAKDPHKGRLAFDAERWFLGKLSQAFAEKPIAFGAFVNVGSDDAFAAIASALDRAAASISGGSTNTRAVVVEGEARSGDATGQLARMAGHGRQGLGEDSGRG